MRVVHKRTVAVNRIHDEVSLDKVTLTTLQENAEPAMENLQVVHDDGVIDAKDPSRTGRREHLLSAKVCGRECEQ